MSGMTELGVCFVIWLLNESKKETAARQEIDTCIPPPALKILPITFMDANLIFYFPDKGL